MGMRMIKKIHQTPIRVETNRAMMTPTMIRTRIHLTKMIQPIQSQATTPTIPTMKETVTETEIKTERAKVTKMAMAMVMEMKTGMEVKA